MPDTPGPDILPDPDLLSGVSSPAIPLLDGNMDSQSSSVIVRLMNVTFIMIQMRLTS